MSARLLLTLVLPGLLLWGPAGRAAPPDIEVEALFRNAVVVKIDGQRKMLKVGESFAGVTLLAAYSRTATFEAGGRQMVLGISRRIGTNYQENQDKVVTIQRDAQLQYRTTATINDRNVAVMVDTGANVVALNSSQASELGIDYRAGTAARVETASGVVNAWIVTLRFVSVGGIRVDSVRASVVEGEFPGTILLGMSYLQHVQIKENQGVLSLSRAW